MSDGAKQTQRKYPTNGLSPYVWRHNMLMTFSRPCDKNKKQTCDWEIAIMPDFPGSLIAFERRFPGEPACAAYLVSMRWPDGFRCPGCGHDRAWTLRTKAWTFECHRCRRQTSVRAGTIMHGSKLPLHVWFWAAYLMATHSNGISARQLQAQLGLGSYKSAWLLSAKLRHAMVDPGRNLLGGLVEIHETTIPHRTKEEPVAGGAGRSHRGKMLVIGAVEIAGKGPGRIRLAPIADYSAASIHAFMTANLAPGATAKSDGWPPTAVPPRSRTSRMSSATWPLTSCSPGSIVCSRTSRGGHWESITVYGQSISSPTSTSSSFASTAGTPAMPPFAPSSVSQSEEIQSPTRC
jgi:hypothetical protein